MGDVEIWNFNWNSWVEKITLNLSKTHTMVQEKAPFDHWILWKAEKELPTQGWKIHISPHPELFQNILEGIVEILTSPLFFKNTENQFSFKIINNYNNFVKLNAGHLGESQIGKSITIYPASEHETLRLFSLLRPLCENLQGPRVPSDFFWSENDKISIRWGQIGEAKTEFDQFGKPRFLIQNEKNEWIEDLRHFPSQLPDGVKSLQYKNNFFKPLAFDLSGPTQWESIDLEPKVNYGRKLKQIWLVKELNSDKFYIYKKVWKGLGCTVGFKSQEQELINEHLVTQKLNSNFLKVIGTKESEYFIESLMEDGGGESLEKINYSYCKIIFPKIIQKLEELHNLGFIHRDLKRKNIVYNLKKDEIQFIDFELSTQVGKPLPCSSGTASYKAPESEKGQISSTSMDVYALAGIIFELCMHRDPSLFLLHPAKLGELLQLNGFLNAFYVLKQLTSESILRPHLLELQKQIGASLFEIGNPQFLNPTPFEIQNAIQNVLPLFYSFQKIKSNGNLFTVTAQSSSSLLSSTEPLSLPTSLHLETNIQPLVWRNNHLFSRIQHQGINIGAAGIAIGFLELDRCAVFNEIQKDEINDILAKTIYGLIDSKPYTLAHGFMTGNAGVSLALIQYGIQKKSSIALYEGKKRWALAAEENLKSAELDFFSGTAGIVFAGLKNWKLTQDEFFLKQCQILVQKLIDEIIDYEGCWAWPASKAFGGNPTLGASHGAAGIAMVLGQFAQITNDSSIAEFATEIFQRIFNHGKSKTGNSLRYDVHPDSDPRSNTDWCHGSAGFLWSLLNSNLHQDHIEKLTEEIRWSANLFFASLVSSNPTYCHGLAGQLELSLMLQNEPEFKEQATFRIQQIQRALLIQRRDFMTIPSWASENPEQFTPDLWVGTLGPMVALARSISGINKALFSI